MTSSLMEFLTPTISSFTYWILYGYLFILYDVFCLYTFDTFGSAFFFLILNNVFLGQENLGTAKVRSVYFLQMCAYEKYKFCISTGNYCFYCLKLFCFDAVFLFVFQRENSDHF